MSLFVAKTMRWMRNSRASASRSMPLMRATWAATRNNGSYLQAQVRRLKGRRGPKKAIVAVAASRLTAADFIRRDAKDYHDLGDRYLFARDKHRVTQRLLRRLQTLGVVVAVKAA